MTPLLELRGLTVDFDGPRAVRAVDGVDLVVGERERVALVGESGAGKTQLLLACAGLLAPNGRASGSARFAGRELVGPGDPAAAVRGRGIGFVFQDASGSLTPHRRAGELLVEAATSVRAIGRDEARAEARALLGRVGLAEPDRVLEAYAHELSGGMRQRVAIALALASRPRLLIADEPTTALDVTVQAEVMALLDALCDELGMALLVVSHDLGVVAALADRIAVMYAGQIVEEGSATALLAAPRHPYGDALLRAVPAVDGAAGGDLATIAGSPPAPGERLPGCRFEPRCPRAAPRCRAEQPALRATAQGAVACHFPLGPEVA